MQRKLAAAAAALLLVLSVLVTACGSSGSSSAAQSDWNGTLPDYSYNGSDPYIKAICEYSVSKWSGLYLTGAIVIPAPVILYTDDSDPSDIRIWGDFRIYHYNLSKSELFCISGGSMPGRFHLRTNEDGSCSVTGFDLIPDGSAHDEELRALCEEAGDKTMPSLYELFTLVDTPFEDGAESIAEHVRNVFIGRYIKDNQLPITTYQDYGSNPVAVSAVLQVGLNGTQYIDTGEFSFLTDEEQKALEEKANEERKKAEESGIMLPPELHIYLTGNDLTKIFERVDV